MSLKSEIIALAIECEERLSSLEITDAITAAADHMECRHIRMEREAEEADETTSIASAMHRHPDTWAGLV